MPWGGDQEPERPGDHASDRADGYADLDLGFPGRRVRGGEQAERQPERHRIEQQGRSEPDERHARIGEAEDRRDQVGRPGMDRVFEDVRWGGRDALPSAFNDTPDRTGVRVRVLLAVTLGFRLVLAAALEGCAALWSRCTTDDGVCHWMRGKCVLCPRVSARTVMPPPRHGLNGSVTCYVGILFTRLGFCKRYG